jgi:hypothetical protein
MCCLSSSAGQHRVKMVAYVWDMTLLNLVQLIALMLLWPSATRSASDQTLTSNGRDACQVSIPGALGRRIQAGIVH